MKELTTCESCKFAFMDFLLLYAKWEGEECAKCRVKRLERRMKIRKPSFLPKDCFVSLEKCVNKNGHVNWNCRVHYWLRKGVDKKIDSHV